MVIWLIPFSLYFIAVCSSDTCSPSLLTTTIAQVLGPTLQQILQQNQVPPGLPPQYENYVGNYTANNYSIPSTAQISLQKVFPLE